MPPPTTTPPPEKHTYVARQKPKKKNTRFVPDHRYPISENFRGLPIFAVFRGQYKSAKIKIAKYYPISVKESSLEENSILQLSAVVSLCFLKFRLFSFVTVRSLPTGTTRGKTNNDCLIGRE